MMLVLFASGIPYCHFIMIIHCDYFISALCKKFCILLHITIATIVS